MYPPYRMDGKVIETMCNIEPRKVEFLHILGSSFVGFPLVADAVDVVTVYRGIKYTRIGR